MEFTRSLVSAAVLSAASVAFSGPLAAQESRIIGGAPILLDQAPSIVALIFGPAFDANGSFFQSQYCAGTLLSPEYVLTAAHCVVFFDEVFDPTDVDVLGNTFDLNNPGGDSVSVVEIMVHENYISSSNSYDIALLRLASPLDLPTAELINPESVLEINESVAIAGWGTRQFDEINFVSSDPAISLEGARVNALPGDICATLPQMSSVDDTMVCAGFPLGGVDACQGDSGGPLYRTTNEGEFVLAGITSWGIGCALEGFPGVYSDVAFFNDWILERSDATTAEQVPPLGDPEVIETEDEEIVEEEEIVVVEEEVVDEEIVVVEEEVIEEEVPEDIIIVGPPSGPVEEEVPEETVVVDDPTGPDDVTVEVNTNEESEGSVVGGGAPVLVTSSGGGSAGGLLLAALATIGFMRRRSVKA